MTSTAPNLFVVGAPRCGTSSLHAYLATHPEIFMTRVKEPHHFSRDLNEERDARARRRVLAPFRTRAQYEWLYAQAEGYRVRGEASVLYLYSKVAAQEIFAFNPAAKIIASVREPVGFLRSLHSQFYFLRDEDRRSFAEALALEPRRKQGLDLPRTVRIPSLLYYSELAAFSEQLGRYLALFPRAQIKVIVFDDLRARTAEVYREILEFLEVEARPAVFPSFRQVNPHREPRSKALALFLRSNYAPSLELYRTPGFPREPGAPGFGISGLLPPRLFTRVHGYLDRLNSRKVPLPPLDPGESAALRARFRPEVERLSALLHRDLLALWGYA